MSDFRKFRQLCRIPWNKANRFAIQDSHKTAEIGNMRIIIKKSSNSFHILGQPLIQSKRERKNRRTFVPGVHFEFFVPNFGQNFEKKSGNAHPLQYSSFSHENQRHCQLLLWLPRKPYVFSLVSALISRNKGKFLLFEKTVFRRIKTPGIWERNTPFTQSCMFTRRDISTYVCALTKRKHIQNGLRQLQKQGRQQKPRKKSFFKER